MGPGSNQGTASVQLRKHSAPLADPRPLIGQRLTATGLELTGISADPLLRPGKTTDLQANFAMNLAQQLGQSPRQLAETIAAEVHLDGLVEAIEVAGPGFLNLTFDRAALAASVEERLNDPRHGVPVSDDPKRVVIDYSCPNVAKEMHVGHLRSTIIGDALARILEATGHSVIRQNHLGDWGTQFGMLVEEVLDHDRQTDQAQLSDLVSWYQQAKVRFDQEPDFARRARSRVVALQAGDPETRAQWAAMVAITEQHIADIYQRMDITLSPTDIRGESAYNADLPKLTETLLQQGLAERDQGAIVIHDPRFAAPLMIEKSDGGYGYPITDLAALRYRTKTLEAERVIYVTDARQSQHFAQVFAAAELAGWSAAEVEHVPFGMVLGLDGKPLKTRSGHPPRLVDLLTEATEMAAVGLAERNLSDEEQQEISHTVALAAIKFADLSAGRQHDYRFDIKRLVSFHGDTGPYLQYAERRAQAIAERAGQQGISPGPVTIVHPRERALAVQLLNFSPAITETAATLQPHILCRYLHRLASSFTAFYESCPVLGDEDAASRLSLTMAAEQTLAAGLSLIGIRSLSKM